MLLDLQADPQAPPEPLPLGLKVGRDGLRDYLLRVHAQGVAHVIRSGSAPGDPAGLAAFGAAGTAASQRRAAARGAHHEWRLRDDRSAGNHRRHRRRRVLHQACTGRRCGAG
ncbi:hypothetical protein G6F55_014220 [Rhizopus delemar]|nr:hypothetical protein G6F55_014220 [Rhizopus delemar]